MWKGSIGGAFKSSGMDCSGVAVAHQQLPHQARTAGWSEPWTWTLSQESGSPGPRT